VFALTLTVGVALYNSFRRPKRELDDLLLKMNIKPENLLYVGNVYTIYDCRVHGEHMQRENVYVVSEYPRADQSYLNAKLRFFPHSNFFLVDRNRAKTETYAGVYYCTRCRAAESEWLRHDYSGVSQTLNTIPQP
jgi:hypothetical protein